MKTLYESILDNEDEIMDEMGEEIIIKNFLSQNYLIKGDISIRKSSTKLIVDVNGSVSLNNRELKNLTNDLFEFGIISGYFTLVYCTELKTLKGAPEKCRNFDCSQCYNLISLEGAPAVESNFICCSCKKLKSLKGVPKIIPGNFNCSNSKNIQIKNLSDLPEKIGKDFFCVNCNNIIRFIKKLDKNIIGNIVRSINY